MSGNCCCRIRALQPHVVPRECLSATHECSCISVASVNTVLACMGPNFYVPATCLADVRLCLMLNHDARADLSRTKCFAGSTTAGKLRHTMMAIAERMRNNTQAYACCYQRCYIKSGSIPWLSWRTNACEIFGWNKQFSVHGCFCLFPGQRKYVKSLLLYRINTQTSSRASYMSGAATRLCLQTIVRYQRLAVHHRTELVSSGGLFV